MLQIKKSGTAAQKLLNYKKCLQICKAGKINQAAKQLSKNNKLVLLIDANYFKTTATQLKKQLNTKQLFEIM